MGKTTRIILLAILAGGGYYLWKRYNASGLLQYGKPGIRNLKLAPNGVSFDVAWPIINPSSTPLTVDNFTGGVYWGSYLLSTLQLASPVVIEAGGVQTPLVFKTSVNFSQVVGNFQAAVASGDWLRNVFVRGKLSAEGLNIGIDQPLLT